MINFRFHLASLIAIFLALALGVVIGAGVIDRGVVTALDSRLDQVEARADRIQADNDALAADVNEKDDAIAALALQATTGTLQNQVVGVVAVRGVDPSRVDATTNALRIAGANLTGTLWLEQPWVLDDTEEVTALAEAIGSSSRRPTALRAQAWQQIAARFALSSIAVGAGADDVLQRLDDAGFVSFDAPASGGELDQFPGGLASSIVLVVGSEGDVPSSDVIMPASTAIVAEELPLVLGDVYVADAPEAGSRGSAFTELRGSALSTTVSTVDDLDRAQGPPTVALALRGLLSVPPVVGHYGLGDDTVLMPVPATS